MNEQAKTIFDNNVIGALATINEDGSPLATPLHMVLGEDAVYWFSKETTVHSQNITRDPRASLTLFSTDTSRGTQGVYISGEAALVDSSGRGAVYELFKKRLGTVPAAFDNFSAYRLPIGTFSEQKSTGNCWYFYS